jgi:penicillin amidase
MAGSTIPKRLGLGGAAAAALAGAAGAGVWWHLFRRSLPRTSGRLPAEGLEGSVEISRDRWGVPHIRADSPADAWLGQGFCQGQDRLWQLDLYRRFASGRVAEFAGTEGLDLDRFMRTLGLRRVAEREAASLDPEVLSLLKAYSAGINAAVAATAALPAELQLLRLEFEPWTPVDSLTVNKLLAFGLSTNWERELLRAEMARELGAELAARLDPGYPAGNPEILRPGEGYEGSGMNLVAQIDGIREALGFAPEATGSNNWAVSAERSATGAPLIAGDPHLPPSMPGIAYQLGIYVDDRFCRGGSLPGIPGVAFGQNNDVAWTFTNVMADVMDLFVERIDGTNYEFEGSQQPLVEHEEEIVVKGAEPETLIVRETHHGPLVNRALRADDSEPLALAWSALRVPCISAANFGVLHFESGPELVEGLAELSAPVSNLIWADRHGSIGYKTVGRLPVRRGGCPDLPKPGWTGEYEWEGWVPYAEQPEVRDPESGYLVTANNKVAPDDFPHHISSDYLDGYRANRISELIELTPRHDLSSFAEMQLDMYSIPGVETAHRLTRLHPRDQRETSAIERLRSWDGYMRAESVAATIYQAFTLRLGQEVARAAIGDRDLAERWLDRAHNGFIAHVTSPWRWQAQLLALWEEADADLVGRPWDEFVLDALRGAMDDLADRFGPDIEKWRWGRVHPLTFPHALGVANPLLARIFDRSLEVGGGQETVAQVGWDPNQPFDAIWAPCWRMVAEPANPERSRWQHFTGQSGHPASDHYDDLQERWRDGLLQPMAGEGPWEVLELMPAASSAAPAGASGSVSS